MVQAPVEDCYSVVASNDDNSDLPQALILLGEMNVSVQHVASLVDNMIQRVRNGEMSTDQGLSFLEMKYNMLLSYLINLTYVVLKKCTGTRSIDADPCVERLVEIRTVLEKIKPIDNKLKYQIDKLVKSNLSTTSKEDDETRWKANPEDMDAADGADDDDDEEDADANKSTGEDKKKKSGVYVPPKISAVHYDEDDDDGGEGDDSRSKKNKANRLKLSASIMQDLREEYLDTPLEEVQGNAAQQLISKRQRERQEYEETYMTRLPVTKDEKRKNKRIRNTVGQIGDELTSYMYQDSGSGSGVKRRKKSTGRKKGKSFKRKRIH